MIIFIVLFILLFVLFLKSGEKTVKKALESDRLSFLYPFSVPGERGFSWLMSGIRKRS